MPLVSQPYAAMKAREYLDKPAIHETMVKVCHPLFIVLILLFKEMLQESRFIFTCMMNI